MVIYQRPISQPIWGKVVVLFEDTFRSKRGREIDGTTRKSSFCILFGIQKLKEGCQGRKGVKRLQRAFCLLNISVQPAEKHLLVQLCFSFENQAQKCTKFTISPAEKPSPFSPQCITGLMFTCNSLVSVISPSEQAESECKGGAKETKQGLGALIPSNDKHPNHRD